MGPRGPPGKARSPTAPHNDPEKILPRLTWISSSPPRDSNVLDLNGSSWLSTKIPVTNLTQELRRTNQFTVRAVCTPENVADLEQLIVSISQVYGTPDLTLRREQADLVFWFRNPLSLHRSVLTWRVRGVFGRRQPQASAVSYEGPNPTFFASGKKETGVSHSIPAPARRHRSPRCT